MGASANKAYDDGHRNASSYSPAIGLAPSCKGLGKNAEEAGEKVVAGKELSALVKLQRVFLPKKPHLILLSRNNSNQQVT